MKHIKAVGFDLFNTLITMEPVALKDALGRLTSSLRDSGFVIEHGPFVKAHSEAVLNFLEQTKRDGKESHNRFWISTALTKLGYSRMFLVYILVFFFSIVSYVYKRAVLLFEFYLVVKLY